MIINDLGRVSTQTVLYEKDINDREINIFRLDDVQLIGKHYPDVKLFSHGVYYNPIREKIMSMPTVISDKIASRPQDLQKLVKFPVFFFIYNVDNYYHFLYDTLPYLISYRHLKRLMPDLKLLINFANDQQSQLNKFVIEFLELMGVNESDITYANNETLYEIVYISNSYTHDGKSNLPPRQEVYDLYKNLANKVELNSSLPRKLYISRRSHKHGKYDNIGTNYTAKRKLVNEDELVSYLESQGYTEIFTELLTTKEKIALFKNCTHVVGPIGGGLCNVLFSELNTKLTAIISPSFLHINQRFCHSFANVDTTYFENTQHVETSKFKNYMRVSVKSPDIVGEICEVDGDWLRIIYSDDKVAGWNAQTEYKCLWAQTKNVDMLDSGLNSIWTMDMNKFKELNSV